MYPYQEFNIRFPLLNRRLECGISLRCSGSFSLYIEFHSVDVPEACTRKLFNLNDTMQLKRLQLSFLAFGLQTWFVKNVVLFQRSLLISRAGVMIFHDISVFSSRTFTQKSICGAQAKVSEAISTFATLRNSFTFVTGHCISCQEMGTMTEPAGE